MQSGTANTLGIGGPELRQIVFNELLLNVGCEYSSDAIECLRGVKEEAFDVAVYNTTKSLDLAYTVRAFRFRYRIVLLMPFQSGLLKLTASGW